MNRVILLGNLGADPEVRYTQNGMAVANFSLAVKRNFAKEGEPDTDWFKCVCFGKRAEFVQKYLVKGSKIALEGSVQNDNYEKDGVKHYGTKVICDNIEFADSKKSQEDNYQPQNSQSEEDWSVAADTDDLPFN